MNLAAAAVVCLLPWAWALAQVFRHQHVDSGAVGLAATFSLGLPALWLTVAGYLDARRSAQVGELTMAHIADQLAVAVGAQWEAEAVTRRLNDPYPLDVSWVPADQSLIDSWDSLVRLASSGAGWPALRSAQTWAADPDGLAGDGGELADVLGKVPTGRLVVLGEPGSGKTMLMVRLVLDLLTRRTAGGPVPFLASIATWNPREQTLPDWLGIQLLTDHPALASGPPPGRMEPTQAAALLASGLILPILDGLDEIPEQVRGRAISRIKDALRPGEHLVVTCRTEQYRDAVRPPGGVAVSLQAAVVQLRPLDAAAVRGYLCDASPDAQARWDPVLAVVGTQTPAGQALSTPLMVGLAHTIYNPRPGELTEALRDPAELCDPALTTRSAVESFLFDGFIPAAYRPGTADRWTPAHAEAWLVLLARHLERTIGAPDLAWWRLRRVISRTAFTAIVMTVVLAAGLAAWLAGPLAAGVSLGMVLADGIVVGAALMIVFGLVFWTLFLPVAGVIWAREKMGRPFDISIEPKAGLSSAEAPARGLGIGDEFGFGSFFGLVVGLAAGLVTWRAAGPAAGLATGSIAGLATGLLIGLKSVAGDLERAASPGVVLARDRHVAFLLMLAGGLAVGLPVGLVSGFVARFFAGSSGGLGSGLAYGIGTALMVGLTLGFTQTAWPSYALTAGWLASRKRLPRRLMDFLADAHRRGVLRQAGSVYQFRHIELQHRLAAREPEMAKIGSGFDLRGNSDDSYRITLKKVIDPAQLADQCNTSDSGRRLVAAVFKIKALNDGSQDVDVNNAAAVIDSTGQSYPPEIADISRYPKFRDTSIRLWHGQPATGSVTFQVPDDSQVVRIQWTPTGGLGSRVQWDVRRPNRYRSPKGLAEH